MIILEDWVVMAMPAEQVALMHKKCKEVYYPDPDTVGEIMRIAEDHVCTLGQESNDKG